MVCAAVCQFAADPLKLSKMKRGSLGAICFAPPELPDIRGRAKSAHGLIDPRFGAVYGRATLFRVMLNLPAVFFATVIVPAALTRATAATYSLEPVADARVYSGNGMENFAIDILSVYTGAGNTQRTFVQFDLSSITLRTNEQVTSAIFTLTASTAFGGNPSQPMEVYRVLAPWTETGLTWLNRDATDTWASPGGDFIGANGQPYAVSTSAPTNGQPVSWDVTALVQAWVTKAEPNYGLLLKSYAGNFLTFVQRESGSAALRPNLTVVAGLPSLVVSSTSGQVVLQWTGGGILQEKTDLNPAIAWADSARTVAQSNGTYSATIPAAAGNNFFRLRAP